MLLAVMNGLHGFLGDLEEAIQKVRVKAQGRSMCVDPQEWAWSMEKTTPTSGGALSRQVGRPICWKSISPDTALLASGSMNGEAMPQRRGLWSAHSRVSFSPSLIVTALLYV